MIHIQKNVFRLKNQKKELIFPYYMEKYGRMRYCNGAKH